MSAIYLRANASDEERSYFFKVLIMHVEEVTLTQKALTLNAGDTHLALERDGPLELPDDVTDAMDDDEDE